LVSEHLILSSPDPRSISYQIPDNREMTSQIYLPKLTPLSISIQLSNLSKALGAAMGSPLYNMNIHDIRGGLWMRGCCSTPPPHPSIEEEPSRSKGATKRMSPKFFSKVLITIFPVSPSANNQAVLTEKYLVVTPRK
jgi:hypothetical protein